MWGLMGRVERRVLLAPPLQAARLELPRNGSSQLGDRPQMGSRTGWETVATGRASAVWLGCSKLMETRMQRPVSWSTRLRLAPARPASHLRE